MAVPVVAHAVGQYPSFCPDPRWLAAAHSPAGEVDPYLRWRLAQSEREQLICLFYDRRGRFRAEQVCQGTRSAVTADRETLARAAMARQAAYVVMAHNHPGGDARPSRCDIETTRRLFQLFAALGIRLVDHAIIASAGAFSFRAAGLI